jgi:hypothetical protein
MPRPQKLVVQRFSSLEEHLGIPAHDQADFLNCYLHDIGVKTVIIEPYYFDRDYLAEFAAYYAVCASGYPNTCQRIHFLKADLSHADLMRAASGDEGTKALLAEAYAGFSIIRPILEAPFGRTVLEWYRKDSDPERVIAQRRYTSHLLGVEFNVDGLAWQQQDRGVSACATVGLWSMLQSSAFDAFHAIPTTAQITRAAHRREFRRRMFPSMGLEIDQIMEAIVANELAPMIVEGDVSSEADRATLGFSPLKLAAVMASFLRSGYPILVCGITPRGKHVACAVGFRTAPPPPLNGVGYEDDAINTFFLHDDNVGPNARFLLEVQEIEGQEVAVLRPTPPPREQPDERPIREEAYGELRPTQLIAATHNDIRIAPDFLLESGEEFASMFMERKWAEPPKGINASVGFRPLWRYLSEDLEKRLNGSRDLLGKVRIALAEQVAPMSLHVGLVRLGMGYPLVDILYDTTDAGVKPFAHVAYSAEAAQVMTAIAEAIGDPQDELCGTQIRAF